jgi:hypothetical protein
MRSPLIAVVGLIALVVSAMGTWPASVDSARAAGADTDTAFGPAKVFDSAQAEADRFPPPGPGSNVGIYPYRRLAGGDIDYRWWNGQKFIGPRMDASDKAAYDALVAIGVTPETFKTLAEMFGGGIDGLYVAIWVLVFYFSSEPIRATSSPSPSPSPSPLPPLADNYGMVISLGSTYVSFDGRVSGGVGGWRYEGSSFDSYQPGIHFCHGPGKVSCTFSGDPYDPDRPDTEMRCRVTWENLDEDGEPKPWVLLVDGKFTVLRDHRTSEPTGWTWGGSTREYAEDRKTYRTMDPSVNLKPVAQKRQVKPVTKNFAEDCDR